MKNWTMLRFGAALFGGASFVALAAPAYADCSIGTTTNPSDTLNCVTTTTTDTTSAGFPTTSRNTTYSTASIPIFANVASGATVDGYGLALTESGTGANALTIVNSGAVTVTAGNTPTAGGGNGALRITANGGSVNYSGTGTIANLGTGDGLQIDGSAATAPLAVTVNAGGAISAAAGNGAVINASGTGGTINATFSSVNATGGSGIVTTTADGAQTINTGVVNATGNGVLATSTSGALTVNATGNVTSTSAGAGQAIALHSSAGGVQTVNVTGGNVTNAGGAAIWTDTTGAQTVNVSAGRTVSGATGLNAQTSGGLLTVNNSGTITGTTAAISSTAQASITNAAGATITGPLVLSAFNDTVTNNGTLTTNGTSDFGAGNDTLTNNATANLGGTVNFGDGIDTITTAAGSTTNVSGTVNLGLGNDVINNAGTFNVPGTLTTGDGNDTLNNSGTYNISGTQDFGIGTDAVNNTGTINVTGAGALTGLETFSNAGAGTINFASGASLATTGATSFTNLGRINAEAGPVGITVPTFTNGATGIIDMQDGANGDVTTITGNYVGVAGSRVLIDANADLTASDRLVVTGNISGSTTLGVQYLGTAATFNPTGALVVDGGGTTAAGSFTLDPASTSNGLLNYALDLRGADYYLTSNFNVGITGLAPVGRMGSDLWYQSFDAYHDGIAGRHGYRDGERSPLGMWANLYWSRDKWGDTAATTTLFGQNLTYSSEIENNRRGAQGGIDFGVGGFTLGVTGGYEHNKANNGTFAGYDIEGYNYGAYALFGSQVGLYGGVMYKRDNYDVKYFDNTRAFATEFNNAHSDGFDGELGWRTTGDTVKFDLNAGLSWVKTHIDPVTLYGATFSYDGAESMRGRLGARMIFPQAWGAFIGGKVFHEFKNDNEGLLITNGTTTGTLLPDPRGTTFRIEGGLGGDAKGGPILTVWGDLGDSKGIGVRAGFRF